MSVVTEQGGELYAFIVDQVSAVAGVPEGAFEPTPASLPSAWASHARGVYRLAEGLLVELDVARLLSLRSER
jgi:chemotaxis signal transduction protein